MTEEASTPERPILFSGPMVRAILDGRKTQTRRLVKGRALEWLAPGMFVPEYVADPGNALCPYGVPGDRLWVRETWAKAGEVGDEIEYRADNPDPLGARWRPSIHMPRWASRLTLVVEQVRVERLQDISEEDATAEGMDSVRLTIPANTSDLTDRDIFEGRWDALYGKRAPWASNPWVWAVTFRALPPEANEGQKEKA